MTIVTVSKLDKSSKGKARVYFNGRHSYDDAVYISQKLGEAPRLHSVINAQMTSKTFEDGKTIYFLNDFSYEKQQPPASPDSATPAPAKASSAGWALEPDSLSRLLSNVLGAAITAGSLKEPSDISRWTSATYRALESVRQGKPIDFDDDPRKIAQELPDPAEPQGYDPEDPGFDSDEKIPF
jgi:hypothetical protein